MRRLPSLISLTFLGALGAAGCAHKQAVTPAQVPTPTAPPPTAAATRPAPVADRSPTAVSPDLRASKNLVEQCKLDVDNQAHAPKFDFDQFDLRPEDRDVLQQVAECLTRGPLAGRQLTLLGRADPRGTDEYNLGLGTRRAHTVASYLEALGVKTSQLAESTRGALDARGTDEAGWRVDRRVDLDLAD